MRILLAIRDPAYDDTVLRFGAHISRYADEPSTLLTIVEDEASRAQAQTRLDRARQLLVDVPNLQTKVRIGRAATEIVSEAEEGGYGLAIVGERQSPNLLARVLSGSTAVRVVEHAPCPVIVAKGRVGPIGRILLCDSGAESPLAELLPPSAGARKPISPLLSRFTAQLADLLRGEEEITILHVMSQISAGPGVGDEQLQAGVEELIQVHAPEGELLKQALQVLDRPGIRVRPKVRHGLVVDEVLEEARVGDYDLVVIGAHRGERWQRILLDDLAHKILVQLDRPVLVVR